jgi:hypothetical protein
MATELSEAGRNTNIIVEDKNVILYGHARAKDVAEGRKKAKEITVYRGVDVDAFIAFLKTHFPQSRMHKRSARPWGD